jgi:hypothetical protein
VRALLLGLSVLEGLRAASDPTDAAPGGMFGESFRGPLAWLWLIASAILGLLVWSFSEARIVADRRENALRVGKRGLPLDQVESIAVVERSSAMQQWRGHATRTVVANRGGRPYPLWEGHGGDPEPAEALGRLLGQFLGVPFYPRGG